MGGVVRRPARHQGLAAGCQRARARQAPGGSLPPAGAGPWRHGQAHARADLRRAQCGQIDADQQYVGQEPGQGGRRGRRDQGRAAHCAGRRFLPVGHARHAVAQDHRAADGLQPGRLRLGGAQRLRRRAGGAGAAAVPAKALCAHAGRALQAGPGRCRDCRAARRRAAGPDWQEARRGHGRRAHQHAKGGRAADYRFPHADDWPHHAGDAARV